MVACEAPAQRWKAFRTKSVSILKASKQFSSQTLCRGSSANCRLSGTQHPTRPQRPVQIHPQRLSQKSLEIDSMVEPSPFPSCFCFSSFLIVLFAVSMGFGSSASSRPCSSASGFSFFSLRL